MSSRFPLSLSVQYADARLKTILTRPKLRRWVQAALQMPAEITLRFVNAEEGLALNRDYRGKAYATNVLTFPYDDLPTAVSDTDPASLEGCAQRVTEEAPVARADIVLCTDVLEAEAEEQAKSLDAHAAHLVVHGILHAQGYDHLTDDDAEAMEALERKILAKLGFEDPYQ